MAIFQDTRELSRQERHVGMQEATGARKAVLATMGYKADGSKNAWGKMGGPGIITGAAGALIAGPQGAILGKQIGDFGARFAATQAAKGSDTADVFKETQDEFMQKKLAEGKFIWEGAKAYATLGGGGTGKIGSILGGNKGPDGSGVKALSQATTESGTQAAVDNLDSQAASIMGEDKTDAQLLKDINDGLGDMNLSDDEEPLEDYEFMEEDENGKYFLGDEGQKIYESDIIAGDKKAQRNAKIQERSKALGKVLGKAPVLGGVAESGMEWYAAGQNEKAERDKVIDEHKRKTAADPGFNLL